MSGEATGKNKGQTFLKHIKEQEDTKTSYNKPSSLCKNSQRCAQNQAFAGLTPSKTLNAD